MQCLNDKIGIVFDETDKKFFDLGNGNKLERATAWRVREDDGETNTKIQTNENHLLTNPQIGKVVFTNPKHPYIKGHIVFLHYLAYETFEEVYDHEGEEVSFVDASFILFVIRDGEYILPPKSYLGEEILEEAPKTPSGIYLTSHEHSKDDLLIRIKYTPEGGRIHKKGDVVITIDKSNYPIEVNGEKLFLLKEHEIVGVKE